MKHLQLPALLKSYNRRKDRSVTITFESAKEVDNATLAYIDDIMGDSGFVLFRRNQFSADEVPTENAEVKGAVSPSKYLRSCLFAKHMADGGKKEDFPKRYEKYIYGLAQEINDSIEH